MDSIIINGDTSAILVGGKRELLQKVWMQLAAHRGQFPYDQNLGSRLYQIYQDDPKLQQKSLQAIEEALEPLPQVKVTDVTFTKNTVVVWIQTEYGTDKLELAFERRGQGGDI